MLLFEPPDPAAAAPLAVLPVVRLDGGVAVGREPRPQQTRRHRPVVVVVTSCSDQLFTVG